jgi:Protein of unknown function (DUF3485)
VIVARGAKRQRGIAALAPIATAVALIALLFSGRVESVSGEQIDEYQANIRRLVDNIPYRVGDWYGKDVPAPPAAVKILRPNALLQRRYTELGTGRTFSLLVVHTEEARDMQGHWPPNCYPASGWELLDTRQTTIETDSAVIPVKDYSFRRTVDGFEQRMNVMGFFVLPGDDADFLTSYQALVRAGRRKATAGLGAAQIQLLSGNDIDDAERKELARMFVSSIDSLIRVIAGGVNRG